MDLDHRLPGLRAGADRSAPGWSRITIGSMRLLNCAILLLVTGAMTIWLRTAIEPCLPQGQWHAMLTFFFVFVLWPALAWSLRWMTRIDPADPYSMLWWW